jgi:hypothetical protein
MYSILNRERQIIVKTIYIKGKKLKEKKLKQTSKQASKTMSYRRKELMERQHDRCGRASPCPHVQRKQQYRYKAKEKQKRKKQQRFIPRKKKNKKERNTKKEILWTSLN